MSDPIAKTRKKVTKALSQYEMLAESDKLLVAVSGGIDSTVLLSILIDICQRAPFNFTLQPVLVDHKFPGTDIEPFAEWVGKQGLYLKILECATFNMVKINLETGKSPCQICSRLRRGTLYTFARQHHYNKIAMGHNRDDFNETILLNMFYSGRMAGMPPKLKAKDGANIVIRPLCYVSKDLIKACGQILQAPLIENTFCLEIANHSRYEIRRLLKQLEDKNPKIAGNLLAAQSNIIPSQLMDKQMWDFGDD